MIDFLCSGYTAIKGFVYKMIDILCFGYVVFKGSVLVKKSYTNGC